jgi:molecular chaperone GrpE (heat shock protein)
LDQKNGLNQRMFDAMHEELKGYKDAFLLESVHKPIIRDLISLYDDLEAIHRQVQEAVEYAANTLADSAAELFEHLKMTDMNIMHNCEFIIEVLARLDVTPLNLGTGKLDKHTQRAVAVESAEHPEADSDIARSVKRGFSWKGRVLRPEEVVIKKWKDGLLVAMAGIDSQK